MRVFVLAMIAVGGYLMVYLGFRLMSTNAWDGVEIVGSFLVLGGYLAGITAGVGIRG